MSEFEEMVVRLLTEIRDELTELNRKYEESMKAAEQTNSEMFSSIFGMLGQSQVDEEDLELSEEDDDDDDDDDDGIDGEFDDEDDNEDDDDEEDRSRRR